MEIFNAGFYDEYDLYGTNNDSANLQIWLYEESNILEMRFGKSNVSHHADYFLNGKPIIGFYRGLSLTFPTTDKLYLLVGDPDAPTVDSTDNLISVSNGLNSYPSNGTVYRFMPKPTGINEKIKLLYQVYPTICETHLNVISKLAETRYMIQSTSLPNLAKIGVIKDGHNLIDVSDLPSGPYIIHIGNDMQLTNFIFIKL